MTIVFSSSGIVGGRKRAFERALRGELEARYRGVFAFIGDPLSYLPHPLTDAHRIRKNPLVAHSQRWDVLNLSCERVSSALRAGKIPFIESFGLDVHTPVIALSNDEDHGRLREQQDRNVRDRVIANEIPPPYYLLLPFHEEWVVGDIRLAFPRLNYYPPGGIEAFAQRQWRAIDAYFEKIGGQNPPIRIKDASMGDMVEYAVAEIARVAQLPYTQPMAQAAD